MLNPEGKPLSRGGIQILSAPPSTPSCGPMCF